VSRRVGGVLPGDVRRRLRVRTRLRRLAQRVRRRFPSRLPAWVDSDDVPRAPASGGGPATGPVVVDATTANPRGRAEYGPWLATGRLRLVGEAGSRWEITPTNRPDRVVVAGRVGDPLDDRQLAGLLRLRGAVVDGAGRAEDPPGPAVAAVIVQLAATGLVLCASTLDRAVDDHLADELLDLVRPPLPAPGGDEDAWERRSIAQRRAAMRHHDATFAAATARPPSVSVVLVSKRPGDVPGAVRALAAQSYPDIEIVVGLHGCELGPDHDVAVRRHDRPVRLVSIPAGNTLGEALGEATRHAEGDLVSKVDDDDRYGPEHIWDLVLAHHYSAATAVGKGAEFVYVEPRGVSVRRRMGCEMYTDVVAGGTILLGREDLAAAGGWPPVASSVDRGLLDRVLAAGGRVYRTHGFGFVYTRRAGGHTWDPGLDYFLHDPRRRWVGPPPYDEFGPVA
jgi:hypothetical protein